MASADVHVDTTLAHARPLLSCQLVNWSEDPFECALDVPRFLVVQDDSVRVEGVQVREWWTCSGRDNMSQARCKSGLKLH